MKFTFFLSGWEQKVTGTVISRNMLPSPAGCRGSPRGRKARMPLTDLLAVLKHSAPFQRHRPALPFHSVPPPQIVEDRLPRRRERVSFRQVPSDGRPRIRALCKPFPLHE
jgi:hypothetical protein